MAERADPGLRRTLSWIAGVVAIATAIAIPAIYYVTAITYETARIQRDADELASSVSQLVYTYPDTWRFFGHLQERVLLVARAGARRDLRRLVDAQGALIAEVGDHPEAPTLRVSSAVSDGFETIGRAAIIESVAHVWGRTGIAAALGAVLAVGMFIALKVLPLRALTRAMRSLELASAEISKLNEGLEQKVKARTAELTATNKELETFAYTVSHDLRAPLRSMDGFSHALLEDCADQLDAKGRDYLERVRGASQKMARLIDDILSLSRVTRAQIEPSEVDLSGLAQATARELRKIDSDRQVVFDIAPGVVANGDARLLRQVFDNLLDNAWKFTTKNPRACIEFGVTDHEGEPAYYVRDDGAGFDMAYADKLFEPFQRLHSATEFAGSGIGLATVARIVRRHGGRVWAESEIGRGATVYFTLSMEGITT